MIWSGIAVHHRNVLSDQVESLWNLVPFFVSSGFLIIGLAATVSGFRFFIVSFFLVTATTINIGFISNDFDLAGRLFYILLAWMPVFLIMFHLVWLNLGMGRIMQRGLVLLSLYFIAFSFPFMFLSINHLNQIDLFQLFRSIVRVNLALSVFVIIVFLIYQYFRKSNYAARSKIRLVLLGSVLSITPLILFSILPELLGFERIFYEASFPWLLFIPMFYGYSIYRTKLAKSEIWIIRIVLFYLTTVLFVSSYWILVEIFSRLIPQWKESWALVSSITVVLVLFIFSPVRTIVNQYVEWSFYGKELSIQTVSEIANLLLFVRSREELCSILVDDLPSRLNWSGSALFLKSKDGQIALQKSNRLSFLPSDTSSLTFSPNSPLLKELSLHPEVVDNLFLKNQLLNKHHLTEQEKLFLQIGEDGIWVLLATPNGVQGVLLLGAKQEDLFTAADRRVLKILALQASVAIHQIQILEEIQAGREELDRTHQQLLVAREEERFHITRDLHDEVIQQLIGINFLVQQVQKRSRAPQYLEQIPEDLQVIRKEITDTVSKIRQIIFDIRPAGLEIFGFAKALEEYLLKLKKEADGIQITYQIDENEPIMSDQWKINLFRITQEAIRNSIKHASPTNIGIGITYDQNETVLEIWDDGCGFQVPTRISEFAQKGSFGLVGLSERVKVLGGEMQIISTVGQGTKVSVRIPFDQFTERAIQ